MASSASTLVIGSGPGIGSSIAQVERQLILATLDRYDGSRERTAEVLGISLKTLYNRMREYGQGGEPGP